MNLFEIAAKIALDTGDFDKGVEKAKKAGSELTQNIENITTATSDFGEKIENTQKAGSGFIKNIKNIVTATSDLIGLIGGTGSKFDVFTKASDIVKSSLDKIESSVNALKTRFEPLISNINKSKTKIQKFINAGKNLVDKGLNKIKSGIETVKSKLEPFANAFNKIKSKFKEVEGAGKKLVESGLNKIQSGVDKVKSKFEPAINIFSKAKSWLQQLKDKFKKVGDEEENTSKKTSTFGETLKAILASDAIKAGINALWNGVKKIGQSFIDVGKSAIEAYGNYEQLVGGVETLFRNSANVVQKYAANAYKTAGLSANEYMETVTGFSASLLQSLGGDTIAAAKLADVAISDMSDNANKMGTDMQSIQDAYQGFAKQNYTMLDNLKLGYGGTKGEMERLLSDANKLNAQQGKHTKYSIKNYSDIISAIHDVQVNMGIYGTTSKEAMSTIQGSLNMTKAAWENLLVGMADDNANFDELINNLVESVTAAFNNILPRIGTVISGIGKLIEGLAPVIVEKLPEVIDEAGPGIANAASKLVLALYNTLRNTLTDVDWQNFGKTIAEKINNIDWVSLIGNLGQTLSNLISGALNLLIGFVENVNWGGLGVSLFNSLVSLIINIDWGSLVSQAFQLLGAAISGAVSSVSGISLALKALIESVKQDVMEYFTSKIEEAGGDIIQGLFNGIIDAMNGVNDWIEDNIVLPFINGFKNAFGIHSPSRVMATLGGYIIDGLINGIKNMPSKVISIFNTVKSRVTSWGTTMLSNIKSIGTNLIIGLWNGINDKVSWITTKIESFGSAVINKIKGIFGIHSPSTVMKQIGNYLTQGLAIGIENGSDKPIRAVASLGNDMTKAFNFNKAADITSKVSEVNSYIPSMISARNVSNNTNEILNRILDVLYQIDHTMYDKIISAIDGMEIDWNDRELGRFVKSYA